MEFEPVRCEKCGRALPKTRFPAVCACIGGEAKIEPACIHRGDFIGTANCRCDGKYDIHWCNALDGHCSPVTPGKTWRDIQTPKGKIARVGNLQPCRHCPSRQLYRWGKGGDYKVGVLAGVFNSIGGTESFHKLLVPRLPNCIGFVSLGGTGDPTKIGKHCYVGMEPAVELAARVDVLVCWAIDSIERLLPSKRPLIINCHHGELSQTWSNDLIDKNLHVTDAIVCVNQEVRDHYQRTTDLPVTDIANAIDPNRTSAASTASLNETRQRYGVPEGAKVVLWCHRHSSEKQPDLAIAIGDSLPEGWIMLLGGSGWYSLKQLKTNRVRLIGEVDNPRDLLAITDVFLSTATHEGFGLAMGEAILSGVPVVATPRGIAADPQLAMQVAPDASPNQWVKAITRSHRTRAARAKRIVEARYRVEEHVAKWTEFVSSLTYQSRSS